MGEFDGNGPSKAFAALAWRGIGLQGDGFGRGPHSLHPLGGGEATVAPDLVMEIGMLPKPEKGLNNDVFFRKAWVLRWMPEKSLI